MFKLQSIIFSGALLCAFATASMADEVDLSSVTNGSWCNVGGGAMYGCASLPTGQETYNGQTFNVGNVWFSSVAANNVAGVAKVTIQTNVMNATSVSTLMNTFWGQKGAVLDSIQFGFSDGTSTSVIDMTGNNTLRDYNNWVWTNSISAPTTEAWTDTSQRLDEQTFSLGNEAGKDLTSITILDWGNQDFSRAFLAAVTVDTDPTTSASTVPEPGYLTFVGITLLGAGLLFRRKRV